MSLQQYLSTLPRLLLPTENLQTPFLSIPWCYLIISSSIFLSFLIILLPPVELSSPCQKILRYGHTIWVSVSLPWLGAYINDLCDQVKSRVRLFADDTAIYLTISSEGESVTLQNDIHTLEIWVKRWDMSFNPSKGQVLHITRAKCPIQTGYILHGIVLESVPSAKYLGITIADNLSWIPTLNQSPRKRTNTRIFEKEYQGP